MLLLCVLVAAQIAVVLLAQENVQANAWFAARAVTYDPEHSHYSSASDVQAFLWNANNPAPLNYPTASVNTSSSIDSAVMLATTELTVLLEEFALGRSYYNQSESQVGITMPALFPGYNKLPQFVVLGTNISVSNKAWLLQNKWVY
jgi:hypothetical protein